VQLDVLCLEGKNEQHHLSLVNRLLNWSVRRSSAHEHYFIVSDEDVMTRPLERARITSLNQFVISTFLCKTHHLGTRLLRTYTGRQRSPKQIYIKNQRKNLDSLLLHPELHDPSAPWRSALVIPRADRHQLALMQPPCEKAVECGLHVVEAQCDSHEGSQWSASLCVLSKSNDT